MCRVYLCRKLKKLLGNNWKIYEQFAFLIKKSNLLKIKIIQQTFDPLKNHVKKWEKKVANMWTSNTILYT